MARALALYESTIAKKVVMAVSGVVLVGYVVGHMLGNLQIFMGAETLNAYAAMLKATPALLWGVRALLLISVLAHIVSAVQLAVKSGDARPEGYRYPKSNGQPKAVAAGYADRTMRWGGVIVFFFIAYHIMHLTLGVGDFGAPGYQVDDVYANVVYSFKQWPVALFYVIAQLALGMHLHHGVWSMFQTIGVNHPRVNLLRRSAATFIAVLVTGGNLAIVAAIWFGLIS